ncbi:MAG: hypothetical protein H6819_10420 [Phycisphaerales bacterium]|nr:hypothetical protein [Phycisphaerales bacterium]MCB9855958.1 hypothetical protein [Phycisphaerales bacterium]MCB9864061.1 hypothetical protein [Phycisphaerales bacterium]
MIVEHEFVTTMCEADAVSAIRRSLTDLGFESADGDNATQFERLLREQSRLDQLNSKLKCGFAFDRGRISIALQLETPSRTGEHHENLLRSLAVLIEEVVAKGKRFEIARRQWDECEAGFRDPVRVKAIHVVLLLAMAGLLAYFVMYVGYPATPR